MNERVNHLIALPDTPRYNIKAVVQQTQVNISTLRAWEQRYGIPRPNRSEHGHRLYSQRDIGIIKWLKQCTEGGLAISQAVAMLSETSFSAADEGERTDPVPGAGWSDLCRQFMAALADINLRQAHLLINTACTLFPIETVLLELFQPALVEIGERWRSGDACVAEERLASNFIRQRLLGLMQLHAPFAAGPRVICACPPDEQHEIGLLMFALLMEQRGWELIYLGQSLASDGLDSFLERLSPALLCVSVSLVEHVAGLLEVCEIVDHLPGRQIRIGYAGRAFDLYPELQQRMPGTFLGNDLREAVNRAGDLGATIDLEAWSSAAGATYHTNGVVHLAVGGRRAEGR